MQDQAHASPDERSIDPNKLKVRSDLVLNFFDELVGFPGSDGARDDALQISGIPLHEVCYDFTGLLFNFSNPIRVLP